MGELGGYLTAIFILRLIASPAIAATPAIELALRIMVAVYLLHLALKLWQRGSDQFDAYGAVTFGRVFVTTLLNPKSIVFAFTILPQNLELHDLVVWLAALALMIVTVGSLWIAIGASLQHGFHGRINLRSSIVSVPSSSQSSQVPLALMPSCESPDLDRLHH
jgi:threonine/homoserine/homoserine lactone efflux protein